MDNAVKSLTKLTKLTIGEAEKDEEVPPLVAAAEDVKPATNIVRQWIAKNSWLIKHGRSPPRQDHLRELGNVEQEGKASKEVHHEHPR